MWNFAICTLNVLFSRILNKSEVWRIEQIWGNKEGLHKYWCRYNASSKKKNLFCWSRSRLKYSWIIERWGLKRNSATEQGPSVKANSSLPMEEIPRINLCNRKVRWCGVKSSPFVPVLTQVSSVHGLPPHPVSKINFNIILPSLPRSCMWCYPSRFPTKTVHVLHVFTLSPTPAACLTYSFSLI